MTTRSDTDTVVEILDATQRIRDHRFSLNPLTAGPDTLWSLVIPLGETWLVDFELVAHIQGGGNSNIYRATRLVKNVAGTVTQTTVGTDLAVEQAPTGAAIDYTNNTTTIRLRYTKPTTGTWSVAGRVVVSGVVA